MTDSEQRDEALYRCVGCGRSEHYPSDLKALEMGWVPLGDDNFAHEYCCPSGLVEYDPEENVIRATNGLDQRGLLCR